jgi:hypothetical protein
LEVTKSETTLDAVKGYRMRVGTEIGFEHDPTTTIGLVLGQKTNPLLPAKMFPNILS